MGEYLDLTKKIQIEILDEIVRLCNKYNLEYYLIAGTLLGAIRHGGFIPWDDDLDIAMPRDSYNKLIKICDNELSSEYELDYFKTNKKYWLPFIKIRKKDTIYEEEFLKIYDDIPKGVWIDIFPLDKAKQEKSFVQSMQSRIIRYLRSIITWKNKYDVPKTIKRKMLFVATFWLPQSLFFKLQDFFMTLFNNRDYNYWINFGSKYNVVKQTIPKDKYQPATQIEFEGKFYAAPRDYIYILKRIYGNYMKIPSVENQVTHKPSKVVINGKEYL